MRGVELRGPARPAGQARRGRRPRARAPGRGACRRPTRRGALRRQGAPCPWAGRGGCARRRSSSPPPATGCTPRCPRRSMAGLPRRQPRKWSRSSTRRGVSSTCPGAQRRLGSPRAIAELIRRAGPRAAVHHLLGRRGAGQVSVAKIALGALPSPDGPPGGQARRAARLPAPAFPGERACGAFGRTGAEEVPGPGLACGRWAIIPPPSPRPESPIPDRGPDTPLRRELGVAGSAPARAWPWGRDERPGHPDAGRRKSVGRRGEGPSPPDVDDPESHQEGATCGLSGQDRAGAARRPGASRGR